jgi:hypothetical protein
MCEKNCDIDEHQVYRDASKKSATNQKYVRKIVTLMNIKTIDVQIMHKEK